jgi:hypothetical protein
VFVLKVQQQTDSVVEISRKVAKKIHKYLPRFHLIFWFSSVFFIDSDEAVFEISRLSKWLLFV